MGKSTFNMSRCGLEEESEVEIQPCTGWTQIQSTNGDDISIVSDDKLKEALRKIWEEDDRSHTNVSDEVTLKYDCPREEMLFLNKNKGGYDLASART